MQVWWKNRPCFFTMGTSSPQVGDSVVQTMVAVRTGTAPPSGPSIHQTCLFCMRLSRHVTAKFGYLRTKVAFEFQMIYAFRSKIVKQQRIHQPFTRWSEVVRRWAQSLTFIFNSERINAFAFWRKLEWWEKRVPHRSVELLNQKKTYQLGVPVLPIRAQ